MRKLRSVMMKIASAAAMAIAAAVPVSAKTYVYVSAAQDGVIDAFEMDAAGALTPLGKTAAGKLVMPMAVDPARRHLYAVVRSEPFRVLSYDIDAASGALRQKADAPLPDSMAYASTDRTGRFLFTASYDGSRIAISAIKDGLVEQGAIQVLPTGEKAHSIRIDPGNRFLYVTNLGSDQILQFGFDAASGKLTPLDPALVKTKPGNGPRHIEFSPDGRFVYVISELSGNIIQFGRDPDRGTLTELSTTLTVPASDEQRRIWSSDIAITPDGRFMYTSERTSSTISLLTLAAASGKPSLVDAYPTETQPRGIRIDPTGKFLLVAGEKSERLSVYRIDPDKGTLRLIGRQPVGRAANWIEIVDLP